MAEIFGNPVVGDVKVALRHLVMHKSSYVEDNQGLVAKCIVVLGDLH